VAKRIGNTARMSQQQPRKLPARVPLCTRFIDYVNRYLYICRRQQKCRLQTSHAYRYPHRFCPMLLLLLRVQQRSVGCEGRLNM